MKNKFIVLLLNCCIAILVAMFIYPEKTFAAFDHLVISEIYPNPNANESEWIELYNPGTEVVDLSEFSLEDGTHKKNNLIGLSIPPGDFLVLGRDNGITFGLNNDGDSVILKKSNVAVDAVYYGNFDDDGLFDKDLNIKAPSRGRSITRCPEDADTDDYLLDFIIALPTPGKSYAKPVYTNEIIITEILPMPDNGSTNEFIEIFNSGEGPIDLSNWQIDDKEGGSSPFTLLSAQILPGQYLFFKNSETKIALNDTEDSVRLIDPSGEVKSWVDYHHPERGQSFAFLNGLWQWTVTPTPGQTNILTSKTEIKLKEKTTSLLTIEQAKKTSIDDTIRVSGIVTAEPGRISDQYFYIEDTTGGIQIYSHGKDFPTFLKSGNLIIVKGKFSKIAGEERVRIYSPDDIVLYGTSFSPEPQMVELSQIKEDLNGRYVKVEGNIKRTAGTKLFIENTSGTETEVRVESSSDVVKPKIKKGYRVEVSGIVSQYKTDYRILPFKQNDVKIIASPLLPQAGIGFIIYPVLSLTLLHLWNIYQIVKRKLLLSPK